MFRKLSLIALVALCTFASAPVYNKNTPKPTHHPRAYPPAQQLPKDPARGRRASGRGGKVRQLPRKHN